MPTTQFQVSLGTSLSATEALHKKMAASLKQEEQSYLVGADPEVFLRKDGKYVPAIGLIGGTKYEPRPYGIGHVQEDNVMAEFNIPPAASAEEFDSYIQQMLDNISAIVKPHGLELAFDPIAKFHEVELYHPQARTIGCDPDYNAWSMSKNTGVSAESMGNIRTASGHVHLSLYKPDAHPSLRSRAVKALDLYLGVPMSLCESKDSLVRRGFYGKAGSYRPKPYGVEYRVLDNLWVQHQALRKFVHSTAVLVAGYARRKIPLPEFFTETVADKIINGGDKRLARNVLAKAGIAIPKQIEPFICG